MYIVTYINEHGDKAALCNEAPYFFLSQSGFDGADAQALLAKAPYQKGKTRLGSNIDQRVVIIRGCLVTDSLSDFDENRRFLLKVFSPLCTGNLYVKDATSERMFANTQVISAPVFDDKDYTLPDGIVHFNITLVVPQNFAEDVSTSALKLMQVTPLFHFPLMFQQTIKFGTLSGGTAVFVNNGDVEIPMKVTIPGFVRTPVLTKLDTGEFIKVHTPISSSEMMIINTGFGEKSVVITDENGVTRNAFHYIDVNSSFFSLDVGENHLKFEAEEGNDNANVTIYCKQLYLGI